MPVDYSRWEGMSEEEEEPPRRPRVTRLDGASTITMGYDGISIDSARACEESTQGGMQADVPYTRVGASAGEPIRRDGMDYKKWDKMVIDESDNESVPSEEAEEEMRSQPAENAEAEDELTPEELNTLRQRIRNDASTASSNKTPPVVKIPPSTAASRHEALVARLSRNGAVREGYLWRQTESEVEISVILPPRTKAKMLKIELLPSDMNHSRQRLSVHWRPPAPSADSDTIFERALAYPVEEQAAEGGSHLEDLLWELCDYENQAGERLLRVTMRKREVHGIVIWWSRAMEGEEEIDTQTLPDRTRTAKLSAQQDVWEEATRMFQEKVASRQKIMVEPSPSCDD